MLNFEYKGISSDSKYVEDQIEALNIEDAAHRLKQQGIIITKLIKSKKKIGETKIKEATSFSFGTGVKTKEVMLFTKQLATMIKAGLRPDEALEQLDKQTQNKNMKKITTAIIKDLNQGNDLSVCFSKHPKIFDNIYINLVKAGEASGKSDAFLGKIVTALEKREKIKSKIKGALTYPAVLFTVAIGVTAIMLIEVMPEFEKMYQQFDAELPAITIALLSISEFMRTPKYSVGTLFLIILFVYIYRYLIKNNYEIRKGWHRFIFKIPIFGLLLKKSIIARVALVLGNLRSAGVDMIETLDIAKSVTTNLIIIEAIENVKRGVFSGKPMGALFEKEKIFPTTFYQLVSVGDKTGKLDDMLNSLAIYYEEEFDDSVANLSTLIEPVMIVFMGVLIGGLLLAMYMPILGIGSAI
jgi:type IV pilus assembly protein PilC